MIFAWQSSTEEQRESSDSAHTAYTAHTRVHDRYQPYVVMKSTETQHQEYNILRKIKKKVNTKQGKVHGWSERTRIITQTVACLVRMKTHTLIGYIASVWHPI